MTERQKKLTKDYGPMFVARAHRIKDDFLYLTSDACSVLTDEEWLICAKSMGKFINELNKAEAIVKDRINETLNEGEKFIDLYDKAYKEIRRFTP